MTLRAVFFDIDDTLFATSEFAARARRRAVEAMTSAGLEVDADAAYAELQEVVREFSSNYGRHFHQLLTRLGDCVRPGVHPAIVIATGVRAYHATKEHMHPYQDAIRILDALRRTDLLRAVLSNGLTIKQAEKLVRLGLANAFSAGAIFISEEMGVAKPNSKIFTIACQRLGIEPDEALYVGDNAPMDMDPAHEAGLHTCLRAGNGRHASAKPRHDPDFVVNELTELVGILKDHFGVEVRLS
jgi:putative hydrolase of the HAD superfamily